MGLFKTPEGKDAALADQGRADAAHAPVGQASTAYERGDALFQVALQVGGSSAGTLAAIEALGWRLDHAGYTYVMTGVSTASTDGIQATGDLVGIYLFRRDDSGPPLR